MTPAPQKWYHTRKARDIRWWLTTLIFLGYIISEIVPRKLRDRQLIASPWPPFSFTNMQKKNQPLPLTTAAQSVIMLWQLDCPPCQYSLQKIKALYQDPHRASNGPLFLINTRDSLAQIQAWNPPKESRLPIFTDPAQQIAGLLDTRVLPIFIFLDEHHRIQRIVRSIRAFDWEML